MKRTANLKALHLGLILLIANFLWVQRSTATEKYENVKLDETEDINIIVYPGPGKDLYLWLQPEYELKITTRELALVLGAGKHEIWFADFIKARFLSPTPSGLDQVPSGDICKVIETAQARTHKHLYLVTADRGAGLAMRGAAMWQSLHPHSDVLAGIILWHPNLYADIPEVGEEAKYIPAVSQTTLPVFVFQPKLSSGRWRLNRLVKLYESGGGVIFTQILPAVRNGFFLREERTAHEVAMATLIPELLRVATSSLSKVNVEQQSPRNKELGVLQ